LFPGIHLDFFPNLTYTYYTMQVHKAMYDAMTIIASGKTVSGRVRHQNQDALLMQPERGLFAVADGMGGMNGGEFAARYTIEGLNKGIEAIVDSASLSPQVLETLLATISMKIWNLGISSKALFGMGAALAAMHIGPEKALIAHAGDCRVYLLRQGSLRQLTKDHSLIEELIDKGVVKPANRRTHPWRGTLSKYMGQKGLVPSVQLFTLQDGDLFLICSDGLTKELEDERIFAIMESSAGAEDSCRALLDEALQNGGRDNISLILLHCRNLKKN
jgi:PPM family protein phosphatase